MDNNQILKLENLFNSLLNREVKLAFAGCLEGSCYIFSFSYSITLYLLTIADLTNENYFKFNLNQVCNMDFEDAKVVFYLDYDVIITIFY